MDKIYPVLEFQIATTSSLKDMNSSKYIYFKPYLTASFKRYKKTFSVTFVGVFKV